MLKCSECKHRIKKKEPVGGLKTRGYRICGKNGKPLNKRPVYDLGGNVVGYEYPEGCPGNGIE